MLAEDRTTRFITCPRCGELGLDQLKTHSYCGNCNYFEVTFTDEFLAIPDWALAILKQPMPQKKRGPKPKIVTLVPNSNSQPTYKKSGGF